MTDFPENTGKGCFGKLGYDTRAEAAKARDRIIVRRRDTDPPQVYACPKCARYHLGRKAWKSGKREITRTPDHSPSSYKSRRARYWEALK